MTDNTNTVRVDIKPRGSSLGIASLVLGILAFLICWIPLLGIIGFPLGVLGLLLGAVGLVIALVRRGASIGFPIAGIAVCALATLITWTVTSAFIAGVTEFQSALEEELQKANDTNQTTAFSDGESSSQPAPNGAEAASTSEGAALLDWAPSDQPVRQGDIQVKIIEARVGTVEIRGRYGLEGDTERTDDAYTVITLEITNLGTTKKIEYASWGGKGYDRVRHLAGLQDEFENDYTRAIGDLRGTPIGRTPEASIRPGDSVIDVLVFERPIDAATVLRLTLPAIRFGGEGMLRLEIPVDTME